MSSAELTNRTNSNSSYGAIEIKRFMRKNTYISFANTLLLLTSILFAWYAIPIVEDIKDVIKVRIPVNVIPIDVLKKVTIPPDEIYIKPSQKIIYSTEYVAGKPIASNDLEEIKKDFAPWDDLDISSSNQDGVLIEDITKVKDDFDKPEVVRNIEQAVEIKDEYDFTTVEIEPIVDLDKLMKTIVYPPLAIKANIQGKVVVSALIGKDGKVMKSKILFSDSKLLDNAALQSINDFVFIPAVQNGVPVNCWINIPIQFTLK